MAGFHNIILACIILNTLAMSVQFHGQPKELTTFLSVLNLVFSSIFMMEAALKIYGCGLKFYFGDVWNRQAKLTLSHSHTLALSHSHTLTSPASPG